MQTYNALVSFGGFIGSEQEYMTNADSLEEAEENILEQAVEDLEVIDAVQVDDDEWEITIGFAGLIGVENTYTSYADDEEDACADALFTAQDDLEIDFDI